VIAAARAEWAKDSQDSEIAAVCERIANSPRGAAFAAAGEACAKQSDCSAFVACVVPLTTAEPVSTATGSAP
jgi:hypothetical protein